MTCCDFLLIPQWSDIERIDFFCAFADPKTTIGVPNLLNWNSGSVTHNVTLHDLQFSYIKLVQKKHQTIKVRIRLHFELGRINTLDPKTFENPSAEDFIRYIESWPEHINCKVDKLLKSKGLSLLVSTKIRNQPWSWEEQFVDDQPPELGIIYDVSNSRGEYYQATPIGRSKFHYITWSKEYDERITASDLETRVSRRGTHTKGFHRKNKVLPKYNYLYPPYTNPNIVCNENIELKCNDTDTIISKIYWFMIFLVSPLKLTQMVTIFLIVYWRINYAETLLSC